MVNRLGNTREISQSNMNFKITILINPSDYKTEGFFYLEHATKIELCQTSEQNLKKEY